MSEEKGNLPSSTDRLQARMVWIVVAGIFGCLAGLAAAFLVAMADFPWIVLLIAPVAVVVGILFLTSTQVALYLIAFSITPLGVVTIEIGRVTVNLPEILILLLFLKELIRFGIRGESPVPFVPYRQLSLFILASLIALITGMVRGNGVIATLQDFRQFTEFLLLYILVAHRVSSLNQAQGILMAYFLGCTLVAIHGILQRFTGLGIPLDQLLHDAVHIGGTRASSFYGATPLGGIMILAIGAGTALLLSARSMRYRIPMIILLTLCLSAAVFSETRASWIALALSFLVILLSIRKRRSVLVGSLAAAVAFSVIFGQPVVERLSSLSLSKAERSLHERVRYFTAAWYIFRDRPILGLGWGCHYEISEILINERLAVAHNTSGSSSTERATVHSAYLQLLVKSGAVGLMTFFLVLSSWLKRFAQVLRVCSGDEHAYVVFVSVVAGLIGYLIHSGFENFFQWPVMAQSFWLLFAVSAFLSAELLGDREAVSSGFRPILVR